MSILLLIFSIATLIVSFWEGEFFDDAFFNGSDAFKKHTVQICPLLKKILYFKNKDRRSRFTKVAVIYELMVYAIVLPGIILSLFISDKELVETIIITMLYADAAMMLVTVIPFGIYFEIKTVRFLISTDKFREKNLKEKVFYLLLRSRR
ncbi:MAG: hypothetical protein IIY02_02015 [Firmicutes bacterium]|nr:hypothetical protein [Bacillota bacterium]